MVLKVILNKALNKYAIVVSEKELLDAVKARIHRDPGKLPEKHIAVKYESGLEDCHIPHVIDKNKGPWPYDYLHEDVVEQWSITEEKFNEAYKKSKQRSQFLDKIKESYEMKK